MKDSQVKNLTENKVDKNREIAIVDYGMGNLASVKKAFEFIGARATIVTDRIQIEKATALVLPGVGAIDDAMKNLKEKQLDKAICDFIESGKPFFGICLGMQMLFEKSYEKKQNEKENVNGLGVLEGEVVKFPNMEGIKIPHMGWNEITDVRDALLADVGHVYFVHSFYVAPKNSEIISSKSTHGVEFTASIKSKNITATQFHPEKSGDVGLEILKKWIKF